MSKKGQYGRVGVNGGMASTRIYGIWLKMRARCYRVTDDHYQWYGARGIAVCEEWLNDFVSFYNWSMQNGYADNLTIDRIDNDGNYEPSNCRWVTLKEQCNNRRSNVLITIDGVTRNVQEWSETTGIKYGTIYYRFKNGKRGSEIIKEVV